MRKMNSFQFTFSSLKHVRDTLHNSHIFNCDYILGLNWLFCMNTSALKRPTQLFLTCYLNLTVVPCTHSVAVEALL